VFDVGVVVALTSSDVFRIEKLRGTNMRVLTNLITAFTFFLLITGSLAAFELGMNRSVLKHDGSRNQQWENRGLLETSSVGNLGEPRGYFLGDANEYSEQLTVPTDLSIPSDFYLFIETDTSSGESSQDLPIEVLDENREDEEDVWRSWKGPSPILSFLLSLSEDKWSTIWAGMEPKSIEPLSLER
jgi:hypothetical protein